jgi:hypothetical protein
VDNGLGGESERGVIRDSLSKLDSERLIRNPILPAQMRKVIFTEEGVGMIADLPIGGV